MLSKNDLEKLLPTKSQRYLLGGLVLGVTGTVAWMNFQAYFLDFSLTKYREEKIDLESEVALLITKNKELSATSQKTAVALTKLEANFDLRLEEQVSALVEENEKLKGMIVNLRANKLPKAEFQNLGGNRPPSLMDGVALTLPSQKDTTLPDYDISVRWEIVTDDERVLFISGAEKYVGLSIGRYILFTGLNGNRGVIHVTGFANNTVELVIYPV